MLLGLLIESEAVANDSLASARKLLSNIQQHHMRIMQLVYDDIIQQNEDKREAVGQIVLSLSMVGMSHLSLFLHNNFYNAIEP